MTQITQVKAGPQELLARMSPDLYREAYMKGMSLSAWLEREDPSQQYKDGLDAFQRLLRVADIRTKSIPQMGIFSSEYGEFNATDQTRALIPEWIMRNYRAVATGHSPSTRALYSSNDDAVGSWANPYAEAEMARWDQQIAPAIPLSELVAITTPIDQDSYRTFYLEHVAADSRMVRVGEGAEVPRVKLVSHDNVIHLHKYGRVMEATYEQLRRQRVDKLALHIARMAVQTEVDKVAAAIDIIVNGDGNTSTSATNHNLTTLDTDATAGTLTLKGWLRFKMQFANPYMVNVVLAREVIMLDLFLLNTGSGNWPLMLVQAEGGFGGFTQINPGLRDGVRAGWTSDAPANTIVGIDARFALENVIEVGSNISEVERFTTRQTQALTITEVQGFAVLDATAARTLTVNA